MALLCLTKGEENQERPRLSEKGNWIYCFLSQSDHKVWLGVLFRGQWSVSPLSPFIPLTSLINGDWITAETWHLFCPGSLVFGLHENWAIGGCSVTNINHPIETCPSTGCVALRPLVGSSADMEYQRVWDEKKHFLDFQFHGLSAPHVLFFVVHSAAVQFSFSSFFGWWWYSHITTFFFTWALIPFGFGTKVSISSPMTSIAFSSVWAELKEYLMYSRRMPL